jgi:hypothetical protein
VRLAPDICACQGPRRHPTQADTNRSAAS